MKVQRVAGNFHVSVHAQDWQTLQMVYDKVEHIDVSHTIERLWFGGDYPGKVDPLNGYVRLIDQAKGEKSGTFKYFLKVVPTTYTRRRGRDARAQTSLRGGRRRRARGGEKKGKAGKTENPENASRGAVRTNLYSVTEYFTPSRGWSETGLPAVFFLYDLSPVVMEVSDAPASFGHFPSAGLRGGGRGLRS